jgi:hypothetical protein
MITLRLSDGTVIDVTSGYVVVPRTGIWMADLRANTIVDLPDRLTVTLGGVDMPAAVNKTELISGMTEVRVLGGAGGIGDQARPKHYHRPVVRHVVADLLRDAGEALSPTSDAGILGKELEAWDTIDLPTGAILSALCEVAGKDANWRVLTDGTVWIGAETWPDSGVESRQIQADGPNAAAVIGTDIPGLLPGTLLDGRRVDTVQHDLEANRTTVLFASEDSDSADRTASAWVGMQAAQDPMGLYASMFRAKVLAQTDDEDYVDVRPDDSRLPDMMKIPLRHGIPGMRVKVTLGSYLLIGWDDGRPHQPFAALWNRDIHVERLSLPADQISLTQRGATEQFVRGSSYRASEDTLIDDLLGAFGAMVSSCSSGPLAPLQPGMVRAQASLTAFKTRASAAGGYLSSKLRGE